MNSISAVGGGQTTAASTLNALLESYDPLDTNKDGVVSTTELAAAVLTKDSDDITEPAEKPTRAAEETVSIKVASALLDVQKKTPAQQSASATESVLNAYLFND